MSHVRKVTLYKHGVGFFECLHEIEGDAEIRLDFKLEEMNEVLKSLTVHDPDGQVVSVSYDSHKALSVLLGEIALELPDKGGMFALLAQLKGAQVRARVQNRTLVGALVGVDQRNVRKGEQQVQEAWLSLWTEGSTLCNLPITEIESIELLDESLQADLSYCLETILKSHKRDSKQLSVFTRGPGKRQLQVSYLVEAPAWKSSYRIVLPKESGQPLFWEGWALVDNPRDEDWEDIELTLVAGLPISFRHDLYSPRQVIRPEIEVERESTVGPVLSKPAARAGGGGERAKRSRSVQDYGELEFEDSFGGAPQAFAACADESVLPMMPSPIEAAARRASEVLTQEVGELFHYKVRHPVTVKRNQSALVPIVGQEAEGGKVVLYNAQERTQNPFAAVELTNSTGLTLEGGPLLVIEEGSYAGEAMLDTLKPNDRRIISYAVDLAVTVQVETEGHDESIHLVRARAGMLELYSARIETTTYRLQNNDDRRKKCWLEHPLQYGWDLHQTQPEVERTSSHYRFVTHLEANAPHEFVVRLKRVLSHTLSLASLSHEAFVFYCQSGFFQASQQQKIDALLKQIQRRNQTQREIEEREQNARKTTKEIERLRNMLPSLGESSDEKRLRSSYVIKIEQAEKVLENWRHEIDGLRKQLEKEEKDLQVAAQAIDFENSL